MEKRDLKMSLISVRLLTLCILLFNFNSEGVLAFVLEGSKASFVQYPKWVPGANGSLEFLFQTTEQNGLLLYTDDGGSYEFFELKLVDGSVRLRYSLGGGAKLLTVGRSFDDGNWHRVRIQRHYERTELIVDNHAEYRSSKGLDYDFGSTATNSYVWMGGLPDFVQRQITGRLTLQVVTLEPRFAGQIKQLVYSGPDGISKAQKMMDSQVRYSFWNFDNIIF